jgi:hypothetical protein
MDMLHIRLENIEVNLEWMQPYNIIPFKSMIIVYVYFVGFATIGS